MGPAAVATAALALGAVGVVLAAPGVALILAAQALMRLAITAETTERTP